ncbi:MAG: hypothetical protein ACI8PZ_004223 [Myxococcota bacterium]
MSTRKRWISAFIVWHWALALPWMFPFHDAINLARVFADMYYFTTGTWQAWYMFAGAPRGSSHLVSDVEFADGRSVRFELPRVADMGHIEAWWGYRYREFEHRLITGHRLHVVLPERAWLAWAQYVLEQVDTGGDEPARVVLSSCGLPTPSLAETLAETEWVDYTARLRNPANWTCEAFYTLDLEAVP